MENTVKNGAARRADFIKAASARIKNSGAFRDYKVFKKISDFMYSPLYVYLLGIIALFVNYFNNDIVTVSVYAVLGSLSFIVCRDIMPALASMVAFSASRGVAASSIGTSKALTVCFILSGAICGISFLLHLILALPYMKNPKSLLVLSFYILAIGFVGSGLFYPGYTSHDMAGAFVRIGYTLVLFVAIKMLVRYNNDTVRYFAFICLVYGLVCSIQLCGLYVLNKEFIEIGYRKDFLKLSWGGSNSIGEALFMSIPFCFYLVCTEKKHVWYYFTAAALITLCQLFTQARASVIVTYPVFVICYFICLICGKNKRQIALCGVVLPLVLALLTLVLRGRIDELFAFFKDSGLDDHGRYVLWNEGIETFLRYPVFGAGYNHCRVASELKFYHNTFVQFLASGGALGTAVLLFHRFATGRVFTVKPNVKRTFAGILIGGVLLISMLDCFYMYFEPNLFINAALVFAERDMALSCGITAKKSIGVPLF